MKGKIIIAGLAMLAVALGIVFWDKEKTPDGDATTSTATKSDFSDLDSLPGFKSQRKKSERERDPEELKPRHEPLDIAKVVLKGGQRFEDLSPEEVAQIEEQQRQIAELIARGKTSEFETQLAGLVNDLELDAEQENALRSHFDSIQADIAAGDLQAHGALAQILRGDGLESVLQGVLTEEQLALYESTNERLRLERAEKAAAAEMDHLTSLLALNKDQTIRAQDILRQSALAQENEGAPGSNVEQHAQLANNLMEQMKEAGADANPLEVLIQGRLQQGRENKIAQLEEVLSPEQLELYREFLQAQDGDLSRFHDSLKAFEQGGSR